MNKLTLYELNFDDKFLDKELIDYLNSMKHKEGCSRRYNEGDTMVGEMDIVSEHYYIYSCKECGDKYYVKDM